MGRLMDSLMAAVGLKPSDRVLVTHEPINIKDEKERLKQSPETKDTGDKSLESQESKGTVNNKSSGNQPTIKDAIAEKLGLTQSGFANNEKHHPLKSYMPPPRQVQEDTIVLNTPESKVETEDNEKGDCLSCRLTGSGVCFAGAGYLMYHVRQEQNKIAGWRGTVLKWQTALLSIVLISLGSARLFNIGIFHPDHKDVPFDDLLKKDTAWLFTKLGQPVPEICKITKPDESASEGTDSANS